MTQPPLLGGLDSRRMRMMVLLAVSVLAAAGLLFATAYFGWLNGWRAGRYLARSEALRGAGAFDAARVAAIRAVGLQPRSARAWRALVRTLPAAALNETVFARGMVADLDPADTENLRRLAPLALATGRVQMAAQALADLRKAGETGPFVDELDLRLAAASGDLARAASAADRVLARDPGNAAARLLKAVRDVRLGGAALAAAEKELAALLEIPSVRMQAGRALLDSVLRRGELACAKTLAAYLAGSEAAGFDDHLSLAMVEARLAPERIPELLEKLTIRAGDNLADLAKIARWLRSSGREDLIEGWISRSAFFSRNPASAGLFLAEAYAAQGRWSSLEQLASAGSWGRMDILRRAWLERARRERSGRSDVANERWKSLLLTASGPADLQMLAENLLQWPGWEPEAEALLWELQKRDPRMLVWSLRALQNLYMGKRNAAGMLRVSRAMLELDPGSQVAGNNFAFFSVLLEPRSQRGHDLARDLHARFPADPVITSTWALSLARRGLGREAVAAIESLPDAARTSPVLLPALALALQTAGRGAEAQAAADRINPSDLFPEEVALLQSAGLRLPALRENPPQ